MIIVKLWGGLGNQMFQYALGKKIAHLNHTELKLDVSLLLDRSPRKNFTYRNFDLDIFNVSAQIASAEDIKYFKVAKNKFEKIIKIINQKIFGIATNKKFNYIIESQFNFNPIILKAVDNTYLDGYWQTEKYFNDIENIIRNEFILKIKPTQKIKDLEEKILNTESVCINVRRGDFVNNPVANKFHGVCDIDYFNEAIAIIEQKISNPYFYIFSDDIDWCRANFKDVKHNYLIVDHDFAGKNFEYYLYLMTKCKEFIIPNSSFGWWAAWLSENRKKNIIAPKKWFQSKTRNYSDLLPDSWIKI
jgi:hypothetical protein